MSCTSLTTSLGDFRCCSNLPSAKAAIRYALGPAIWWKKLALVSPTLVLALSSWTFWRVC
jgi:hypothetical protein